MSRLGQWRVVRLPNGATMTIIPTDPDDPLRGPEISAAFGIPIFCLGGEPCDPFPMIGAPYRLSCPVEQLPPFENRAPSERFFQWWEGAGRPFLSSTTIATSDNGERTMFSIGGADLLFCERCRCAQLWDERSQLCRHLRWILGAGDRIGE